MVLSCMDPRFQHLVHNHLKKKKLTGKYSAFTIAGAAVGVTHNKFKQWHKTFYNNLATSIQLHKIEKLILKKKYFGLFRHKNRKVSSHFLRGFSDDLIVPVSRWTEISEDDITKNDNLEILLDSNEVGPCLVEDKENNFLFLLNHLEYDGNTLSDEYLRDRDAEKSFQVPKNYFPNDDPKRDPINRWRSHAHLLYGNWINEIYQTTPFDIEKIGLK